MTTSTRASLSVDDMLTGEILLSLKQGNRIDNVRPTMTDLSITVSLPSNNLVDVLNFDAFRTLSPMVSKELPAPESLPCPIITMTPRGGSKRYGPIVQLNDLRGCFGMPIAAVAHKFGICVTLLKKICRRHGIQRWPHRQIRSLQKSISLLRETFHSAQGTNKEYIAKKIKAFELTLECMMQHPNTAAKGISAGRLASPATEEMTKRSIRAKSRKLKARAALSDDEEAAAVSSLVTTPIPQDWTPQSGARRLNTRRGSLPMSLQSILC